MKPNTVIHYHAVIHRALKYAVKTDLIDVNPADKVDRPKKNEFTGNFYSKDEMNALFDAVRGSKIEVAVMLTAFYGLRRSEVVGLKWAAVDFEQNTIEICHTVTTVRLDGKEVLVESNGTKTKSSKRTLPLVPVFRERLLALQEEQKENRKPYKVYGGRTELVKRLLADTCELCGSKENIEVHHIRKLADVKNKGLLNHPTWAQVMAARNRKTLVVCRECHVAIHNGTINKPLS